MRNKAKPMWIDTDYIAHTPIVDLIPTGLESVHWAEGCVWYFHNVKWVVKVDVCTCFFLDYQTHRWEVMFLGGEIIYLNRAILKNDIWENTKWLDETLYGLPAMQMRVYDVSEEEFPEALSLQCVHKSLWEIQQEYLDLNPKRLKEQSDFLEELCLLTNTTIDAEA
jgi:hypothetical protein